MKAVVLLKEITQTKPYTLYVITGKSYINRNTSVLIVHKYSTKTFRILKYEEIIKVLEKII